MRDNHSAADMEAFVMALAESKYQLKLFNVLEYSNDSFGNVLSEVLSKLCSEESND